MRNKLLGGITLCIAIMLPVVANSYDHYADKKIELVKHLYDANSEDEFHIEIFHYAGSDLREAMYKYERRPLSPGSFTECDQTGAFGLMRFSANDDIEDEGDVLRFNLLDDKTVRVSLFGKSVKPKAYKDFVVNCSNKGQCVIADLVTPSDWGRKASLIEGIEYFCYETWK